MVQIFDLRFLHNVYLPAGKDFSEADLICVCEKGIVVIESKNYSGWIFGNDENKYWTQSIYNRSTRQTEKFRFYNPVWQNATHVKNLRKAISDESIPVWSVIVFGDNCQLKDVTLRHDDDALIFKTSSVSSDLGRFLREKESVLSGAKIDAIYSKLYPYTRVSSDTKKRHIEWIQEIKKRG